VKGSENTGDSRKRAYTKHTKTDDSREIPASHGFI
jgi:hypothetical protein